MSACTPSFFRDLFVGLTIVSLIISPFGCTITTGPIDTGGSGGSTDTGPKTGLFLNSDQTSPVLMAGLGSSGDSYFVYGTRDSSGNPAEIQAIVVRQADGKEANIKFDNNGRPVGAQGPDGSKITIAYTSVTVERLSGTVTLFNAADGTSSNYTFDVNPTEAAEQVAASVKQQTGIDLTVPSAAEAAAAGTQKAAGLGKSSDRSLAVTFFIFPLFLAMGIIAVVMAQMFVVMYVAMAVVLRATLIAIFSPIFLLTSLFNETALNIEIEPLFPIFGTFPHDPRGDDD